MSALQDIFNMSMAQMSVSDYMFTINRLTHTIFIDGSELDGLSNDGYAIIIYNPRDDKPLIISIFGVLNIEECNSDEFEYTYKSEDGNCSTFIRSSIKKGLIDV